MNRLPKSLCALLAVAFALAACANGGDDSGRPLGADTSEAAADRMLSPAGGAVELGAPVLTAAFERMAPDSVDEISGTARLYPDTAATGAAGGGFRLEIVMDGLSAGGHAWHLRGGACGEAGAIVVPFTDVAGREGLAGPLEADAALTARGLVTVPGTALTLEALRNGTYGIHVYRGVGQDPGAVMACADLSG